MMIDFFLASVVCVACLLVLKKFKIERAILDLPSHRSLHLAAIARTGGIGIATGFLSIVMLQNQKWQTFSIPIIGMLASYGALFFLSLINDIKPISSALRLILHLCVSLGWTLCLPIDANPLLVITLTLVVAWSMNIHNFMDGSDGLAGTMTFIGFGAYAVAAFSNNGPHIVLLSIAICGSSFGFLCLNWPPAKLFMGDAGSIPLGFLAAAIGIVGVMNSQWKPSFPFLLFAMFWIDATYTLARRAFRGEKVWQAHNEHWYQKAIRAGNSHRKILSIHLTCNIVIAGLALLSTLSPTFATPLVHILTIAVVLAIAFGFGVWAESQFRGFQAKQIN